MNKDSITGSWLLAPSVLRTVSLMAELQGISESEALEKAIGVDAYIYHLQFQGNTIMCMDRYNNMSELRICSEHKEEE